MENPEEETAAQSPRILMVDDDLDLAQSICDFLIKRGYRLDHAPSVLAARRVMAEIDFDLFLLDLIMPGTSGKVLCREIASRLDAGIIMVSSIQDDAERIALPELGADDYIVSLSTSWSIWRGLGLSYAGSLAGKRQRPG